MIPITRELALRILLRFNLVVRIISRTGFQRIILPSRVIMKRRTQDSPGNSNIKRCLLSISSSRIIIDLKLARVKNTSTLLNKSHTTSIKDKRLNLLALIRVAPLEINTSRNTWKTRWLLLNNKTFHMKSRIIPGKSLRNPRRLTMDSRMFIPKMRHLIPAIKWIPNSPILLSNMPTETSKLTHMLTSIKSSKRESQDLKQDLDHSPL